MFMSPIDAVPVGEVFQAEHPYFGAGLHDFMKTDQHPSDTGGLYVCVYMGSAHCGMVAHFAADSEVRRGPAGSKVTVTF